MIYKKEIDISMSPFAVLTERIDFMDPTIISWLLTPTIIFRHPQSGLRNFFLQPLSTCVWALTLLVFFTSSVLATAAVRLESQRKFNFARSLIIAVGVVSQQGIIENLGKSANRTIMFTLCLFSLIIFQFYSSFIVGSLLTTAPKTINTVRQLIDSKLEIGMEDHLYAIDFFKITHDKDALELYEKKIAKQKILVNITAGLDLIQKGGFAVQVDISYADRMIKEQFSEDEICELNGIMLFKKRYLFPMTVKHSPFGEFFRLGLRRLLEKGILDYHIQKWASKPKCVTSITKTKSVDIYQAAPVFFLLAFATIASFAILIVEVIYFKKIYSRKK